MNTEPKSLFIYWPEDIASVELYFNNDGPHKVEYVPRAQFWDTAIGLVKELKPDASVSFINDWNRARKQAIAVLEAARDATT